MKKNHITIFVLASFLFHILLFFLFWKGMEYITASKMPVTAPLWVEFRKIEETKPPQIADIQKPLREELPDQAKAEALYNQKVAEETVRTGLPKPSKIQKTRPSTAGEAAPSGAGKKDLYAMKTGEPKIPGMPEAKHDPFSADDYLPDYKVGNRTYINTLANPDIRYFVELKRKYRLTWNPVPALRVHANEISHGKISVVLGVSVNRNGELANLVVIRSSGFDGYDIEGKRTVRASAPYSTPPANLLAEDGMLHMAWTFTVYL